MSASMFDYCSFTHQFKLNFEETKNATINHVISSGDISAGGHLWRIECYPRGYTEDGKGEYLSIYLHHESESKDAKAIFEASVLDRDGAPSSSHRNRTVHVYKPKGSSKDNWGWHKFVERSVLESRCLTEDGSFIVMCGVKVVPDNPLDDVPPSDIGNHLGALLDCADGSDVSFVVDGEEYPAHRAVLAARSPVFKAQLLGSMADAKMASITLHDIAPATFKLMLRFIYTDDLLEEEDEDDDDDDSDSDEDEDDDELGGPATNKLQDPIADKDDDELGGSATDKLQDLLAAADRYALDRLKLLCARKLWDSVSVDTVAATLSCAETHNCPELKKKCVDFFADEKNFKKAVLTDGYAQLVHKFPSIIAELREKSRDVQSYICDAMQFDLF